MARCEAHYGDFTKINNRWYATESGKTHARLQENPEEWAHYHTLSLMGANATDYIREAHRCLRGAGRIPPQPSWLDG